MKRTLVEMDYNNADIMDIESHNKAFGGSPWKAIIHICHDNQDALGVCLGSNVMKDGSISTSHI